MEAIYEAKRHVGRIKVMQFILLENSTWNEIPTKVWSTFLTHIARDHYRGEDLNKMFVEFYVFLGIVHKLGHMKINLHSFIINNLFCYQI